MFSVRKNMWILFVMVACVSQVWAESTYPEQEWGVGAYARSATIPFNTADDNVTSFVPVLFYQGERFFLDGLEGGVTLFETSRHQVDLLGRMRFFDIPREYQNIIQEDTVDFGVRYRLSAWENLSADLEVMTDDRGRWHANARLGWDFETGPLDVSPFLNLRHKSRRFNDHYYGLTVAPVGSGQEISLGADARLHLWRNLYMIGKIQSTWLEDDVRELSFVDQERVDELYLGMALMPDKKKAKKPQLSNKAYLRFSHGWATESNIGQIFAGEFDIDSSRNQLSSIFYGHPLTDELFGLPLDLYLTPGFLWNWSSSTQPSIQEYVVAIKAYYSLPWDRVEIRLGIAEGLSYVSDIPYVEKKEMERKGYAPSNLMNYLDFSMDVNLGDLFRKTQWQDIYLGYAIHHRSAIFGSASQFGRISGGANFHTVYLQVHF